MNEGYREVREKPWGSETVITPPGLGRVGKIIRVNAGARLSLQRHTEKEETLCLLIGEAQLLLGEEVIAMQLECGYTITPGTVHRLQASSDSVFLEVSTPETGVTERLEDDYSRGDEVLSSV